MLPSAALPSEYLRTGRAGSTGLPRRAPWFQIKEDLAGAATTVYVILSVVDNLKTILAPTLCVPHTAQQLHEYLGYEGQLFRTEHVTEVHEETRGHEALTYNHSGTIGTWAKSEPPPLLKKLDESLVDGEYKRLEA